MKKYKTLFAVSLLGVFAVGCVSTSNLAKELAKDDATVVFNVNTIYGTSKFIRTNPRDGQSATVAPDGTVTIGAGGAAVQK